MLDKERKKENKIKKKLNKKNILNIRIYLLIHSPHVAIKRFFFSKFFFPIFK